MKSGKYYKSAVHTLLETTNNQQNIYEQNQELSTLEDIRDYLQKKIDVVNGFDKYNRELSTLENIKDYVQININDILTDNF